MPPALTEAPRQDSRHLNATSEPKWTRYRRKSYGVAWLSGLLLLLRFLLQTGRLRRSTGTFSESAATPDPKPSGKATNGSSPSKTPIQSSENCNGLQPETESLSLEGGSACVIKTIREEQCISIGSAGVFPKPDKQPTCSLSPLKNPTVQSSGMQVHEADCPAESSTDFSKIPKQSGSESPSSSPPQSGG